MQKYKFIKIIFSRNLKEGSKWNFNRKTVGALTANAKPCLGLSSHWGTASRVLFQDLKLNAGTYGHKS